MPIETPELNFSAKKFWFFVFLIGFGAAAYIYRDPIFSFIKDRLTTLEVRVIQRVVTEEEAVIAVAEKASPAVVSILQKKIVLDPFTGPLSQKQGIGTGFVIKSNGVILTNRHVVAEADADYFVVTKGGVEYDAKEIHRDFFYDLAIIKVDASDLPTINLGDSDRLKIGQTAVAIGNALGQFSNTVTRGVVSGIGRQVGDLEDVIQTDTSINPGNSGGPLLNLSSEVIGINVAIIPGSENIGFSIPINVAKPVLDQFERLGRIVRPFLGVNYYLYTEDEAKLRGLAAGAFVIEVIKDSGAEKAGVKPKDVITEIDGQKLVERRSLAKIIVAHNVGDVVTLTIDREGQVLTLKATLGESPPQE